MPEARASAAGALVAGALVTGALRTGRADEPYGLRQKMRDLLEGSVLYEEVRISHVIVLGTILLLSGFGVLLVMTTESHLFESTTSYVAVGGLVVVFILGLAFFRVRLTVLGSGILFTYGIGLFESHVEFAAIRNAISGPNASLKSWLYAPLSPEVVVLTLRSGEVMHLPVEEPRRVLDVLRARVESKR